jgi:hypothetical protein
MQETPWLKLARGGKREVGGRALLPFVTFSNQHATRLGRVGVGSRARSRRMWRLTLPLHCALLLVCSLGAIPHLPLTHLVLLLVD